MDNKFVSTYIVRQLHWTIVHCETAVGAAAAAPRTGPRSGRSLRRVQPNSASPPWWSCPFGRSGPESSSAFAADAPRLRNISDIPFGLPCFASRWWLLLLAGNCKSQIKRTGVITGWLVGWWSWWWLRVGWLVGNRKEREKRERAGKRMSIRNEFANKFNKNGRSSNNCKYPLAAGLKSGWCIRVAGNRMQITLEKLLLQSRRLNLLQQLKRRGDGIGG